VPVRQPPEQRLADHDPLKPWQGDRLGAELEQSAAYLHSRGGLRNREAIVAGQLAELEEQDAAQKRERGREAAPLPGAEEGRGEPDRGSGHDQQEDHRLQRERDAAQQHPEAHAGKDPVRLEWPRRDVRRVVGTSHHVGRGCADRVPTGEKEILELARVAEGEEGQGPLARTPSRDVHPQLGQAEKPCHKGLNDVDALQPVDPDPP